MRPCALPPGSSTKGGTPGWSSSTATTSAWRRRQPGITRGAGSGTATSATLIVPASNAFQAASMARGTRWNPPDAQQRMGFQIVGTRSPTPQACANRTAASIDNPQPPVPREGRRGSRGVPAQIEQAISWGSTQPTWTRTYLVQERLTSSTSIWTSPSNTTYPFASPGHHPARSPVPVAGPGARRRLSGLPGASRPSRLANRLAALADLPPV